MAGRRGTEFRVLGAVEAIHDGRTIALGGPRQQAMLALLLLEPGRAVADDRLADELWHGEPPRGAATTLRVYVSRLRSALPDAPIARSGAGYVLDVPPDQIDAQRFQRLLAEGREALESGAAVRAAGRLREALELWRGRPFGTLADDGMLALEARRLEELYVLALEERVEAELRLGADAELVDELEVLVGRHPYRERLWRQLMLALYRSGRQADALAAYRRARTLLDEELGVDPSEELRALEQAILRQEVPAAQPPSERHNLPAPLTSFVGREEELAELRGLLEQARLVTLTGIGGVGKTRLALEEAHRTLPDFPDGVWFADLSALTEPELVLRAVTAALEVADQVDAVTTQDLAAFLREANLLLVLDNCEHLRVPIGELAHDLLTSCPRLRLLTTSREALGTPGEVDYEVSPLALTEAVQLFVQRARASRPRFSDDERALASVARICSDLEGLPLAVELAAARTKALSLQEIEERLADRFRFLGSWRRLATARHRTLRETMDWSWELLPPHERSLLADLSVFAGGFTLGAVAAVCVQADDDRALALVERLVDASLVVAEPRVDHTRYRLLETVRQYAAGRLVEAGTASDTRQGHAEYYLELAEAYGRDMTERGTFSRTSLDPDDANLRAALAHFDATGSTAQELRLCAALWRYWWQRGEIADGREQLHTALAHNTDAVPVRGEALRGASTLALRQGDYETARTLAQESVELSKRLNDGELARGQVALANALGSLGNTELAHDLYTEAATAFRAAERRWELANVLLNMGDLALNTGDLEAAERIVSESLSLCRRLGEEVGVALNLGNLAFIALERADGDSACAHLVQALERSHAVGYGEWVAIMLIGLGAVATIRREDARAAELLGAGERLLDEVGASLDSIERRVHARTRETLRERLGDDAFAAALDAGRGLSTANAVEVAISSL